MVRLMTSDSNSHLLCKGRNAPDDKGEEVHNEAADDLTQVLRKRQAD
ncbi:hypothetical protein V6N13_032414 [Hibiscus sabdariffa]